MTKKAKAVHPLTRLELLKLYYQMFWKWGFYEYSRRKQDSVPVQLATLKKWDESLGPDYYFEYMEIVKREKEEYDHLVDLLFSNWRNPKRSDKSPKNHKHTQKNRERSQQNKKRSGKKGGRSVHTCHECPVRADIERRVAILTQLKLFTEETRDEIMPLVIKLANEADPDGGCRNCSIGKPESSFNKLVPYSELAEWEDDDNSNRSVTDMVIGYNPNQPTLDHGYDDKDLVEVLEEWLAKLS